MVPGPPQIPKQAAEETPIKPTSKAAPKAADAEPPAQTNVLLEDNHNKEPVEQTWVRSTTDDKMVPGPSIVPKVKKLAAEETPVKPAK
jgi:hypothetical protein